MASTRATLPSSPFLWPPHTLFALYLFNFSAGAGQRCLCNWQHKAHVRYIDIEPRSEQKALALCAPKYATITGASNRKRAINSNQSHRSVALCDLWPIVNQHTLITHAQVQTHVHAPIRIYISGRVMRAGTGGTRVRVRIQIRIRAWEGATDTTLTPTCYCLFPELPEWPESAPSLKPSEIKRNLLHFCNYCKPKP